MARLPGISKGVWRWIALGLGALALAWPAPAGAAPAASREYQIKAVFLFNFAQFVVWPPEAFASPDAPLRIGILGDDPFGAALDQTISGERVHNRKLVVVRSRRPEDLIQCQLVFISRSERDNLPRILAALDARPVLTVSEIPGFAQAGGMINFYLADRKVRFEINPKAARTGRLRISAQLLSVGTLVEVRGAPRDT